jgi:hypothetical protein
MSDAILIGISRDLQRLCDTADRMADLLQGPTTDETLKQVQDYVNQIPPEAAIIQRDLQAILDGTYGK